jgi:hypothetical protein
VAEVPDAVPESAQPVEAATEPAAASAIRRLY